MRAQEIHAHVRKRPFVPIRVFLSDGSRHDVRHPEFILVTQREVVIGTPSRGDQIPETTVYIDPIHITRIEPINGKKRRDKPRKVQ
jgi:hypothetical protein